VRAAIALAVGLGLAGSAASQPPPFIVERSWPQPFALVADCLVTAKQTTRDCHTGLDGLDKAFLDELRQRPRKLPGAPTGARVWVLVRRDKVIAPPPPAAEVGVQGITLAGAQAGRYPQAARAAKVEWRTTSRCLISDDGRLDDCWAPQDAADTYRFARIATEVMRQIHVAAPLPADRSLTLDLTWAPPGPSPYLYADCMITAEATTQDCISTSDPNDPDAAAAALAALSTRPLHLPGAPAGQRLTIMLNRVELFRPKDARRSAVSGPPPKPQMVGNLRPDDLSRYYPDRAMRMEVGGRGLLRCKLTDEGLLDACWVRAETPPDMGFGQAAMRGAALLRVIPLGAAAPPYDEQAFDIPISFGIPR
jgi:hypothetical protein